MDQTQKPQDNAAQTAPIQQTSALLDILRETEGRAGFAQRIVESELAKEGYAMDQKLAALFARSGAFDDLKKATMEESIYLAMTKIRLGRSWGLNEADAMLHVNFYNGKPTLSAEAIAAKMYDSGLGWDIHFDYSKGGDVSRCSLHLKELGKDGAWRPVVDPVSGERSVVSFGDEEASKAMVWEKGKQIRLIEKWNYQSWKADMYYAACLRRARKRYRPNVCSSAMTRADVDETTNAVEAPVPESRAMHSEEMAQATKERSAQLTEALESAKKRPASLRRAKEHPPEVVTAPAAFDSVPEADPENDQPAAQPAQPSSAAASDKDDWL